MSLEALGLSSTQALVYQRIAERRTLPFPEAGRVTGLTGDELREAVAGLTTIGLLIDDPDRPGLLIASPPDVTGRTLLLDRSRELHQARVVLDELTARFRDFPDDRDRLVEVLPGLAVSERLSEVQSQAEEQVLIIDAPPYLTADNSNPLQMRQMTEGIVYRTIYDRQALEAPGGLDRIATFVAAGERARVMDRAPAKLLVVDRRYALLPQQRHILPSRCGAFLVHPSPLLDVILGLFDLLWAQAMPATGDAATPLSGEDHRLLVLLLSGSTDEAICRQLGVAKRTVARRVRLLMDRVGAQSRMQLGFRAAQLGWLPAPRAPRPHQH